MAKVDYAEQAVADMATRYYRDGKAHIEKHDPPSKVVGRPPRIIYLENPFLDFHGTFWPDTETVPAVARSIVFEVKSTKDKALAFDARGLKPKQCAALHRWHVNGSLTGVLWYHDAEWRWWPWRRIHDVMQSTRKSLPWGDGYPVPQVPFPDFLPTAEQTEHI